MNRNVLKIIALITMVIDHIGMVFFPDIYILRIIGRLSFPIFAFFVAEGYYYTRSKKKYALHMLLFMVVSWVPYCWGLGMPWKSMNIMGAFLLSLFGMFLVDKIRLKDSKQMIYISAFCFFLFICFILEGLEILVVGLLGVSLPIVFYAFKDKPVVRYVSAGIILVLFSLTNVLYVEELTFECFIQFFSLLALIPIMCYNNNVGRLKLKYLFYIAYPLHLFVIMLIKLI